MKEENNKNETNCIFCKIINGELPSTKIFENEKFLVFMDIRPVNHGHLLIIPKEHIPWMQEAPDEIIREIFVLAKNMMIALKKAVNCDYVKQSVVGTEVPHFHIHLIPRYFGDNEINIANFKEYKDKEMEIWQEKIVKACDLF